MLRDSDILDHVSESCKTNQVVLKLGSLYSFIGEMKDHAENSVLFPRLRKVFRFLLTIPNSNAEEEQVFFHRKEEQTCFRPTSDPEETLVSQYGHCKTGNGV